jgi:hypothetical protein
VTEGSRQKAGGRRQRAYGGCLLCFAYCLLNMSWLVGGLAEITLAGAVIGALYRPAK